MLRFLVHYFLHLVFPVLMARVAWPARFRESALLLLGTMLVDLDHLLADPIYDPTRCSIGFHPLHSLWAVGAYIVLLAFPGKIRIVAIGLLLHMATDGLDCLWMRSGL